jgi:hypothetical protein
LNPAEVPEIASSLRQEQIPGDWMPDEAVDAWINSDNDAAQAR